MAGYLKIYVVGSRGGFMGTDGVNQIEFLILDGDADRQWLEPRYFDKSILPIGKLGIIIPPRPDHPDSLLDACIAFYPHHFRSCPSLAEVQSALREADRLDFNACPQEIPIAWAKLREEARPRFATMNIWSADLIPIEMKKGMPRPSNMKLPFFAYGLFRPGQIAFFKLRDLISKAPELAEVKGSLRLRDGLPILDREGSGSVKGVLLTFFPERVAEAYDRISAMEPENLYRWHETTSLKTSANVLVGCHACRGSERYKDANDWNGWNDPLFTDALNVVQEILDNHKMLDASVNIEQDLTELFRLQMAYLLLWSSIERYVSLRYHLGERVVRKVDQLAAEEAFAYSLQHHVTAIRTIYRADRPEDNVVLDPNSPKKAVKYYYQVRSNITHRGKSARNDYVILIESLSELLPIFRDVLKAAEQDAGYLS